MKLNIKTIIATSLLLAGTSLHAVSPETLAKLEKERTEIPKTLHQFSELPRDVQVQILGAINEGSTPLETAKRLGQLRRVNKQVKAFIESPYSGKYLMQKIADRFPAQINQLDPEKKKLNRYPLLEAAANLGTQGALAWIKEQSEKDPTFRKEIESIMESELARASIANWPTKIALFLLKSGIRGKYTNEVALEYALSLEPLLSSQEARENELDFNGKEFKRFDDFITNYNLDINGLDGWQTTLLDRYKGHNDSLSRNKVHFLQLKGAKTAAELQQGQ